MGRSWRTGPRGGIGRASASRLVIRREMSKIRLTVRPKALSRVLEIRFR